MNECLIWLVYKFYFVYKNTLIYCPAASRGRGNKTFNEIQGNISHANIGQSWCYFEITFTFIIVFFVCAMGSDIIQKLFWWTYKNWQLITFMSYLKSRCILCVLGLFVVICFFIGNSSTALYCIIIIPLSINLMVLGYVSLLFLTDPWARAALLRMSRFLAKARKLVQRTQCVE